MLEINKFKSYSITQLLDMVNSEDSPDLRKFICCLFLTYKVYIYSKFYSSSLENTLISASVISVYLISKDKKLNKDIVYKCVADEFNEVTNSFSIQERLPVDIIDRYQTDHFQSSIVDIVKYDLIRSSPKEIRNCLTMGILIQEINYNLFPIEDQHLINLILNQQHMSIETNTSILNELDTTTKQAMFLYYLYKTYPSSFILFSSLKDLSNVLLLLRTLNNPAFLTDIEFMEHVEDSVGFAVEAKWDKNMLIFSELVENINFSTVEGSSMESLLTSTLDTISDQLDKNIKSKTGVVEINKELMDNLDIMKGMMS